MALSAYSGRHYRIFILAGTPSRPNSDEREQYDKIATTVRERRNAGDHTQSLVEILSHT
jgi:hypothetical protein